jgi:mono/diheme cytochrome c family protein
MRLRPPHQHRRPPVGSRLATLSLMSFAAILGGCRDEAGPAASAPRAAALLAEREAAAPFEAPAQGRYIFRHWTFGDEPFWTDTLHLNQVVEQAVSPATALAVGLKVDAERLPPGFLASADLTSPATTVELLRRDAVLGVEARVTADNHIARLGITCALCHSTVDNSVTAGVGRRLDGWPNRDLNVGAIVALSPALPAAVKAVFNSWGPGKYDAEFNRDGINSPVVIPPAFGLRHVALETYTGEGPVSYWNAYVAVTQMHGHGSFSDPALGINIQQRPDRVTPVLPVLRAYQLSLGTPAPPAGSVDRDAAVRGQAVFNTTGRCASCHIPSLAFSDVNLGVLHDPAETGMDPVRAGRLKNHKYRTTPLRALWQHPPYFHDGSAATLADVVAHYDGVLGLGLTPQQQADLVQYLKSL